MLVVSLKKYQKVDEAVELRSDFKKPDSPVIFKMDWEDPSLFEVLKHWPDYVDLNHDVPLEILKKIKSHFPSTQVILSFHNFEGGNLGETLSELLKKPADLYKVALFCEGSIAALEMMSFKLPEHLTGKVIRIPMGEEAKSLRLLGPVIGNAIDYCCLNKEEKMAPGQWDLETLIEEYHFKRLDPNTSLFALIGDPVEQSRGHLVHNRFIRKRDLNAVYLKIKIKKEELKAFFSLIKKLPFKGLSVTMPLKEEVIPFLDKLDVSAKRAHAVNTIVITHEGLIGHNTDGRGALNALEKQMKVKDKRVVILGAGGSARAIATEARQRGAHLTVLNRTLTRAQELASLCEGSWGTLDQIPEYDILINTTPIGMIPNSELSPISNENILAKSTIFDIIAYPPETRLLKEAKFKNCKTISGSEMFIEQANLQFTLFYAKYRK